MSSLWDKALAGAKVAGDATKTAAYKTKLRTDMLMIDRDIQNRKKLFGINMYDHVSPLSQSQDFYAATDDLTTILRPPLINAQKEIQALAAKRVKLKEALASAEAKRAAAFPTKAETVGQKFLNLGKASVLHSNEAKIKTELAVVDRQIKAHKQTFGLELYETLAQAEDTRGYLPSDRQVRNLYDNCRGDIQRLILQKKAKEEEIKMLGGTVIEPEIQSNTITTYPTSPHSSSQSQQPNNNYASNSYTAPVVAPTTGGFSDHPSGSSSSATQPSISYTDNNNDSVEDLLL